MLHKRRKLRVSFTFVAGNDDVNNHDSPIHPIQEEDPQPPPVTRQYAPLWVLEDGLIIHEYFKPYASQLFEFLSQIAVPLTRPELIHEYRITEYSLHLAHERGIDANSIILLLNRFGRNDMSTSLCRFIHANCSSMNLRIVVDGDGYFLRSDQYSSLNKIRLTFSLKENAFFGDIHKSDDHWFLKLNDLRIMRIKETLHESRMYITQECPQPIPNMSIELKESVAPRPYQLEAISKMFIHDVVRSGLIVLPCGSGKTLVGILACAKMKKRTLIVCVNTAAAVQWKDEFGNFTICRDVHLLSADHLPKKNGTDDECVLITTYSMIGHNGKRNKDSSLVIDRLLKLEWGLMILDEVHMVPATHWRSLLIMIKHNCAMGMSATLRREDDKIEDLFWLIGPILYEVGWRELQDQGYLARLRCIDVQCDMTTLFYKEYLNATNASKVIISKCNPNKVRVMEYLVHFHEDRGDKVIVFCDSVPVLRKMAIKLQRYFICGDVAANERRLIIDAFKNDPLCKTIFLSRVGDSSLNLPNANVVIQLDSFGGSQMQEAQRIGRIIRPKRCDDLYNAFFYSIISRDTNEELFAEKRPAISCGAKMKFPC